MTRVLIAILMIFWSFSFILGQKIKSGASHPNKVEQEVLRVENTFNRAGDENDLETVNKIVADDYINISRSGQITNKADFIARFKPVKSDSLTATNPKFPIDEMKVQVMGNAAFVTGRVEVKLQDKGQENTKYFRYLNVYVERHGRWRLVTYHDVLISQQ